MAESVRLSSTMGGQLPDALAEIFDRLNAGEAVDLEAIAAEHPDWAAELKRLLPTMAALADLGHIEAVRELAGEDPKTHGEFKLSPSGTLGDYRIIREIGRGGMGVVYEAEQISLARRVALKILPFAAVLDKRHLTRFQNEARAAATLNHPHLVPVYGVGEERGVHYYAMQLIPGRSLAEVIEGMRNAECGSRKEVRSPEGGEQEAGESKNTSPESRAGGGDDSPTHLRTYSLPASKSHIDTEVLATLSTDHSNDPQRYFRRIAEIGRQLADALAHAHAAGIIHRDIKPGNVLLDGQGQPWITDFGLARIETEKSVTASGAFVGTLRYMSPEQVLGKRVVVDHRTDVYSLGVTLYELATLRPAFGAGDRQELLRQIASEQPPPPRQLDTNIPRDLETILLKAMSKEPAARYASADELVDDLGRFGEDRPIVARRASPAERLGRWARHHKPLLWSAVAIFVIALASVAFAWRVEARRRWQADRHAHELEGQLHAARMEQARAALANHRAAEAASLLDRCPSEQRGWEWRYLHRLVDRADHVIQCGEHVPTTRALAFSPDGAWFATATERELVVRDARSLKTLWTWSHPDPKTRPHICAFSPDSQRILIGHFGGYLTMHMVATGEEIYSLRPAPAGAVWSVHFSPEGDTFFTGTGGGDLALRRTDTGNAIWEVKGARWGLITCIDVHHYSDNRWRLVTTTPHDYLVRIWDAQTGKIVRRLIDPGLISRDREVTHRHCPTSAIYSPDGRYILTTGDDGVLKRWDAESGDLLDTISAHDDFCLNAAYSPDGRWVATIGQDSTVRLWYGDTLEEYAVLNGHTGKVVTLAYSPDGSTLASASILPKHTVRLWNAGLSPNPRLLAHRTFTKRWPRENSITSLSHSSGGQLLVAGHLSGHVTLWEPSSGNELATLGPEPGSDLPQRIVPLPWMTTAVASPDGRYIASTTRTGRIRLWRRSAATGQSRYELVGALPFGYRVDIEAVAISTDSSLLAAVGADGRLAVWDLESRTRQHLQSVHGGAAHAVSFSPNRRWIATGGDDGLVRVLACRSGELQAVLRGDGAALQCLDFSPDGELVVAGDAAGAVLVWDRASQERLQILEGHAAGVRDVAFHPHESRIASASSDGTIKLWSPSIEDALLTLRPQTDTSRHGREVFAVAFTPDGESLVGGLEDQTIRIWDAGPPHGDPGLRRNVDLARHAVNVLVRQGDSLATVLEKLRTNAVGLSPEIQPLAIEIAEARLPFD